MLRRLPLQSLLFAVLLGLLTPLSAQAQNAGVTVDAEGVLRMHLVQDPTGALTRQRIAAARAQLDPDIARPSKLRMVSLNRLEATISDLLAKGAGPTDDMKFLAGLTSVQYVFFLPDTKDVVIAGPAEGYAQDLTGRPVGVATGKAILELQDLIVALRAFPPSANPTPVISVSIDPTREGLQAMQKFLVAIGGRIQPSDAQRIAEGLRENLGLQTVTIKGVSTKTHFAQVLVEADYRMKLIGIGLEKPAANIPSYVSKANPRDVSRDALKRWYFTPNYECVRMSEDGTAMELVGDGVKLIGADEVVNADGVRQQAGQVDRASQQFTTAFTKNYGQLAANSPVYAQLKNLIDLSIAAAYLQQQDIYAQAGWEMKVFRSEEILAVENFVTPAHVPSAVNVVWKGNTLMTPVGGGVNIQPRLALASENLLEGEGDLRYLKEGVKEKTEALEASQWWWDAK